MGIRLPRILSAKLIFHRALLTANLAASNVADVPKGHLAVYVGEAQEKRFLVPISYINRPQFLQLLHNAEDEFGYDHPMGGLTIPRREDAFLNILSRLSG